jgi:hypothetical protein
VVSLVLRVCNAVDSNLVIVGVVDVSESGLVSELASLTNTGLAILGLVSTIIVSLRSI